MFEVEFENLGYVKKGNMKVNKLTVLTGENNTGKTYAAYAVYGLIQKFWSVLVRAKLPEDLKTSKGTGAIELSFEDIFKHFDKVLNELSTRYSEELSVFFRTSKDKFKNSFTSLKIDKNLYIEKLKRVDIDETLFHGKGIGKIHFKKDNNLNIVEVEYFDINDVNEAIKIVFFFMIRTIMNDLFLLPAERTGLNLFYRELNINRNKALEELGSLVVGENAVEYNVASYLSKKVTAYPKPIADYIEFLNKLNDYSSEETSFNDIAVELQKEVIGGTYHVDDLDIYFVPNKVKDTNTGGKLNLHVASSTAKTLFGLAFYLTHMAKEGDLLIIDEPEQNLHPDNQRKIARILAKIANRGIKVIISTHSDYIIKEFNNLIMLKNEFKSRDKLMKKYKYKPEELLDVNDISPYIFNNNTMQQMKMIKHEGIIATTFDNVINAYNASSDEIYYTLEEEKDSEQ